MAHPKTPTPPKIPPNSSASGKKIKSTFVILNDNGLHTRPSTELVKCTNSFKSHIQLSYRGNSVNAKSLFDILTLGATKGGKIQIEATGEDADAAVQSILSLAQKKFNIRY